jgi:hypothetical protein
MRDQPLTYALLAMGTVMLLLPAQPARQTAA